MMYCARGNRGRTDAVRRAFGEPAGVIEMQVRRQHDVDRIRRYARQWKGVLEIEVALEPVNLGLLRGHLIARARIDQHRPCASEQHTPHRHPDAIALVGRRLFLPKSFWDDTEHRPAVEVEKSVRDGHDIDIAKPNRLGQLALGEPSRPAA